MVQKTAPTLVAIVVQINACHLVLLILLSFFIKRLAVLIFLALVARLACIFCVLALVVFSFSRFFVSIKALQSATRGTIFPFLGPDVHRHFITGLPPRAVALRLVHSSRCSDINSQARIIR